MKDNCRANVVRAGSSVKLATRTVGTGPDGSVTTYPCCCAADSWRAILDRSSRSDSSISYFNSGSTCLNAARRASASFWGLAMNSSSTCA